MKTLALTFKQINQKKKKTVRDLAKVNEHANLFKLMLANKYIVYCQNSYSHE